MLKITVLAENTGCGNCQGEHGLSLFIENNTYKILLDAGKSSLFAENASMLGVDLQKVDFAVLSHSHYDHADGFDMFFEINETAKLYVREGTGENYFSMHGEELKYIGPRKGMLKQYQDRVAFVDEAYARIEEENMFLIPHSTENLSAIGEKAKLYKQEKGEPIPDDFAHEQSFVIKTSKGLVIFNSCSHGGPANIIREVLQWEADCKIYAYIGGFHLSKYPEEDVLEFAETLKALEIERIITGHCTGESACEILKEQLGNKVEVMHSGMVIEI
jgi:7,8-dihydropterin-6-yl-methyl-4-(beta-D-ribofuranosyl)aminobenzene 5'-phosphate synthase